MVATAENMTSADITPHTPHETAMAFIRLRAVRIMAEYLDFYALINPGDRRLQAALAVAEAYALNQATNEGRELAFSLICNACDDAALSAERASGASATTRAASALIATGVSETLRVVVDPTAASGYAARIDALLERRPH